MPVHGIELSRAMAARLQAKPGAEAVGVTIGDFATATVEGTFSVAYLVFNTIMNLTTQDAQVACFRNVAAHLEPGGCFVVEVGVPDLRRLPPGETARVFHVSEDRWGLDEYDVARQGLVSHHFETVEGRIQRFSAPFRYVWPAELDLMAWLAGLRLRDRWEGWQREPFTGESRRARVRVGEAGGVGAGRAAYASGRRSARLGSVLDSRGCPTSWPVPGAPAASSGCSCSSARTCCPRPSARGSDGRRAGPWRRPRRRPPTGCRSRRRRSIVLVSGRTSAKTFLRKGRAGAELVRDGLARQGVELGALHDVLDFGVGCGRVARHWHGLAGPRIHGCDVQPELVAWTAANLPFVDARVTGLEPPLPYPRRLLRRHLRLLRVHAPARGARARLGRELRRVLRPGGHLLISTHGEGYVDDLSGREAADYAAGRLVVPLRGVPRREPLQRLPSSGLRPRPARRRRWLHGRRARPAGRPVQRAPGLLGARRGRVRRRAPRSADRAGGGGQRREHAVGRAGGDLDHRAGAPAGAQPPRADAAVDPHGPPAAVQPHEVEREAHAEGVDGAAARQVQRPVPRQRVERGEAEQPRAAAARRGRGGARRAARACGRASRRGHGSIRASCQGGALGSAGAAVAVLTCCRPVNTPRSHRGPVGTAA